MAEPPQGLVDTKGWDSVSVLCVAYVNQAFASGAGVLTALTGITRQVGQTTITGNINFGNWSVAAGNQTSLLQLTLPIGSNSAISYEGQDYTLDGVSVLVEVNLKFVNNANNNGLDLKFDLRAVGEQAGPDSGAVYAKAVVPAGKLDDITSSILLGLIAEELVANAAEVTHILASVSLIQEGSSGWLAPVHSTYAMLSQGGVDFLGVLSVVTDRDISQLPVEVDPSLLPSNPATLIGGLAISGDMFLQKAVQPLLEKAYNVDGSAFYFDGGSHTIRNTRSIGLPSVKAGAIWYDPFMASFQCGLSGNRLHTEMNGGCDLKLDISMSWNEVLNNALAYDPHSQSLLMSPDPNPSSTHDSDVPWWLIAFGWLPDMIAGLVADAIAGTISGNIVSNTSQTMTNAGGYVSWPGLEQWQFTQGGLAGNFYMWKLQQ